MYAAVVGNNSKNSSTTKLRGSLLQYHERRNLKKSPEPTGSRSRKIHGKTLFVVQKHAARSLHYDVRLEIDGVLKSWAVPKGPPKKLTEKRLAIATEDHPYEYAFFAGTIPAGHYGAGKVIIWDRGHYTNIKLSDEESMSMSECYRRGRIEIYFHGKKLIGPYALVRMARDPHHWLMLKIGKKRD